MIRATRAEKSTGYCSDLDPIIYETLESRRSDGKNEVFPMTGMSLLTYSVIYKEVVVYQLKRAYFQGNYLNMRTMYTCSTRIKHTAITYYDNNSMYKTHNMCICSTDRLSSKYAVIL